MKLKNILAVVAISAVTSAISVSMYGKLLHSDSTGLADTAKTPVHFTGFNGYGDNAGPADFTQAATTSAPAVVHIQTHIAEKQVKMQYDQDDPFVQLFGLSPRRVIPEQRGSGSGVILSEDGYIVTNNHVIQDADNVTVTLANHKTYPAVVVGADAKTDLAVLKINASNLPFLLYGNSDDIKLGQWVLAIGYPWNLDITVTAGIISAKTRTISTDNPDHPAETYIQTDAAVNLGNSGGALINTNGELVGINSALASPTGAYAGYSYAIPVNIVKKKVDELIRNATGHTGRS
ncbi:MAG TPA: trypsin-like peptidase domain-containing protein [Chitinophagaceae bacterium]|nr:trypsin-like peptidase domain-containing protein [Chitinophagaceae bacterium]